jgi:Lysozyme like domain
MLFILAIVVIALFAVGIAASVSTCCGCPQIGCPTVTPGRFSFSQLVNLAQSAGFNASDAITAAAIAIAESGGNPSAYNPEIAASAPCGLGSYGLWQIYLNAHPEFTGQNLYDPSINAQAAFSVWKGAGNSFSPWSTFKSGVYSTYLPSQEVAG